MQSLMWKIVVFVLISASSTYALAADEILWEAHRNGKAVVLMRHAIAPGNGDPVSFSIGDCKTQRNLSAEGRSQADRIGKKIRSEGIKRASVFTSEWCRCADTASLLRLGVVQGLPILNSFYQDRSTEAEQTQSLANWLTQYLENAENVPNKPVVMVSHQVNITALTGVFPSSGEMVFVGLQEGEIVVLGTHLVK